MRFVVSKIVRARLCDPNAYYFRVHLLYDDGTECYFGWTPGERLDRGILTKRAHKLYDKQRKIAEQRKKIEDARARSIKQVKLLVGQKFELG